MAITTVAYVFDPKYILKSKNLYSGNIGYIEIPKQRAIDIDDELDLIVAKKLIRYAKKSV